MAEEEKEEEEEEEVTCVIKLQKEREKWDGRTKNMKLPYGKKRDFFYSGLRTKLFTLQQVLFFFSFMSVGLASLPGN